MSPIARGIVAGLAAGALWGFSFLVPKLFHEMSPGEIALARCFGFFVMSVPFLGGNGLALLRGGRGRTAMLLGLMGYTVYYFVLIYAIRWSGIAVTSLIIGLIPVTVGLAGKKSVQRPERFKLSLILIVLGILALNLEGLSVPGKNGALFYSGVCLSFFCLFLWTKYALLNADYLKNNPGIPMTPWSAAIGVYAFLTVLPLALGESFLDHGSLIPRAWGPFLAAAAILGVGCSFIATIFWNVASRDLPVGLAGQLIVSETVFALLYGFIYDRSWPAWHELTAVVLLLSGVLCGISAYQKVTSVKALKDNAPP